MPVDPVIITDSLVDRTMHEVSVEKQDQPVEDESIKVDQSSASDPDHKKNGDKIVIYDGF